VTNAGIWIALLASLLSCYFSAVNVALKAFSRSRLSELFESKGRDIDLDRLMDRVPHLLLLTGSLRAMLNFLVLLALVYHFSHWQENWQWWVTYLAAFVSAAVLVSVFSLAIPGSWGQHRPEQLVAFSKRLLEVLLIPSYPLVAVLHSFDPIVRRVSGAESESESNDKVSEDIMSIVEEHESEGAVDPAQRQMFEAVIEFTSTTAGEIMTPRTDVKGVEIDSTLEDIKQVIFEHGHSRMPVYDESLDSILGLLYAKDMLQFIGAPADEAVDLRSVLREALMVPESKSVAELLAEFKARKVHIAIVLDEYGGTAGLVTIEDIIEEIVGEIEDEYESGDQEPQMRRLDANTIEADARAEIDDINDAFDLELPEDEDYETIGGFVFSTLGHIPDQGESFDYENIRVTVTAAERTRVIKVKLEVLQGETADLQTAREPRNGK